MYILGSGALASSFCSAAGNLQALNWTGNDNCVNVELLYILLATTLSHDIRNIVIIVMAMYIVKYGDVNVTVLNC